MIEKYSKGMSLAEVVIAATVITVFMAALVGLYNFHMRVIFGSARQVKATFLAEEGLEAIKYLRNLSWSTYIAQTPVDTDLFIAWHNGKWTTTTDNIYIDGLFERKIVLSPVERNAQSNIVSSNGTLDPNVKKLTVTISWSDGAATTTRSVSTYITNLFDN
jgi:hypothetical protein